MPTIKHVALHVPDLREAEGHYREIFAADLVGREAVGSDGRWRSLRPELGWDDAARAGIELHWVGLRRDDLVIALFQGQPNPQGTLYCIGLTTTAEERADIRGRLPDSTTIEDDTTGNLTFVDMYGFRWQCLGPGFGTAGDLRGDWIDADHI